jgi:hypothetical protein
MKKKSLLSPALAKRAAAVPLGWPPQNLIDQKDEFVKKVVFDLHGPILDWSEAFCEVAASLYGVDLNSADVRYYSMAYDSKFPLTPEQFNNVFATFARLSKGGYGALKPRPGIVETFKKIQAAGIVTEIWTWVPGAAEHNHETLKSFGTGIAQQATYELIESLGLVDNVKRRVRFIAPTQKVPQMLEEHAPLIIEDNPVTAVHASSVGHAAILTPEPYNVHTSDSGILRLNDHSELADVVIDFFAKLEAAGSLAEGVL